MAPRFVGYAQGRITCGSGSHHPASPVAPQDRSLTKRSRKLNIHCICPDMGSTKRYANDSTSPPNLVCRAGHAMGRTRWASFYLGASRSIHQRSRRTEGAGGILFRLRLHLAGNLRCDAWHRTSILTMATGAWRADLSACLRRGHRCSHRRVSHFCLGLLWLNFASDWRHSDPRILRPAFRHRLLPCRGHNISSKRTREKAARRLTPALRL